MSSLEETDKKNVNLDEISILKEHIKIVLTYVSNLENRFEDMDKTHNKFGENLSLITNKMLKKINGDNKSLLEIMNKENKSVRDDMKNLLLYLRHIENNNNSNKNMKSIEIKIKELNENNDFVIKAVENNRNYVDSLTKNLKKVADFIKESASVKLYDKLSKELEVVRYEYSSLNTYDISENKTDSKLSLDDQYRFNRFYDDLRQLKRNHFEILESLKENNKCNGNIILEFENIKKNLQEKDEKINSLMRNTYVLNDKFNFLENNFKTILNYVRNLEHKVELLSLQKVKDEVSNEITSEMNKHKNDNKNDKNTTELNNGNISLSIEEI